MTQKKLNILFLASWYPNKIHPKNGNFIQQHARAVSQHCNVVVLHIISNHQDKKFEVVTSNVDGIFEVIVYYKKINGNSPIHKYQKLKRRQDAHLSGYHEILNAVGKIDLTHLNVTFPAGLFALYLKKKYKIPYIITEHSTTYLPLSNYQFSIIETKWIKKIGKNSALICPVSEDLAKNMRRFGINGNYQVVPNVVDTSIFKYSSLSEPSEKVRLLHLSNLKDEHKNITGILNSIKLLSQNRNDFILTIAGDGDTQKFKEIAKDLDIPKDNIKFEGEKTIYEVAELIRKNDFFLLYSNYENLPCVISESLIMGLPVISTNVGGINEMLDDENGLLIQPKNDQELLNGLNYMIDNLKIFNRQKIAENAFHKYSAEVVSTQFLNIYTKILKH
jgi:glycosyltransferase involved in cell wall biosynthesis